MTQYIVKKRDMQLYGIPAQVNQYTDPMSFLPAPHNNMHLENMCWSPAFINNFGAVLYGYLKFNKGIMWWRFI